MGLVSLFLSIEAEAVACSVAGVFEEETTGLLFLTVDDLAVVLPDPEWVE